MLVDETSSEQPPTPEAKSGIATLVPMIRQGARRLGWGVADQAVSSLTNFAVSIFVARSVGAAQFGAFSLAYVTYGFALNASRGLATDPLMVRFSGADLPTWRRAVARCTGTASTVGLAACVCALGAVAVLDGTARLAFLALALTLPGLLLQDSWRYAFFALGRGSQAFLNDLIWAVTLFPALLLLRSSGHGNVFWFVFAWGASAAVGAAAGPLQARVLPRLSSAKGWVSEHRDLGPRYLIEGTSSAASNQLRTYALGLVVSLAAVGYLQAANTLMGPFMVIFFGISLVTVPEAARVLRRSPRHLPLFCLVVSTALAIAGLAWGIILLIALPRGLGSWLLGPIWRPAYPLILPLMLSVIGSCLSAGAGPGLHALGAAKRSLRAMVLSSAVFVICGVAGAVEGGAVGAVQGAAVATWIGVLLWWWQLRAALRESGTIPAGGRFWSSRRNGRHRDNVPRLISARPATTSPGNWGSPLPASWIYAPPGGWADELAASGDIPPPASPAAFPPASPTGTPPPSPTGAPPASRDAAPSASGDRPPPGRPSDPPARRSTPPQASGDSPPPAHRSAPPADIWGDPAPGGQPPPPAIWDNPLPPTSPAPRSRPAAWRRAGRRPPGQPS